MYEPLIAVGTGQSRETSRAAKDGEGPSSLEECYHADCYEPHAHASG